MLKKMFEKQTKTNRDAMNIPAHKFYLFIVELCMKCRMGMEPEKKAVIRTTIGCYGGRHFLALSFLPCSILQHTVRRRQSEREREGSKHTNNNNMLQCVQSLKLVFFSNDTRGRHQRNERKNLKFNAFLIEY
jgi:hypothetical protein